MMTATLLHTQTETTHITNPRRDLNNLKQSVILFAKCKNMSSYFLGGTYGKEEMNKHEAVPRIMFSDCNNQKTPRTQSPVIGATMNGNIVRLAVYYFSDNLIFGSQGKYAEQMHFIVN